MSDSYKPFSLSITYVSNPAPSPLTKPFNLVARYDATAGDSVRYVGPYGFDSSIIENPVATYTQNVGVSGIGSKVVFGLHSLKNKNQTIDHTPVWWQADRNLFTTYGVPKIELWKQIIDNTPPWWQGNRNLFTTYGIPKVELWKRYVYALGFDTNLFGTANLLGGVKFVNVFGFNSNVIQPPLAINTKADQYANLNNHGIAPPLVSTPNVFPQILYAKQFIATQWGNPLVQFPPRPKGFDASLFGIAWISHSPRYLEPNYIDAFNSGYPKVFDPTQKIGVTGVNTVIAGGIFGDTSIRNTRRIIKVSGLYSQSFSDWGVVESNLRNIVHNGLDNQNFGSNAIWNKTPSITPIGINSFTGLNAAIGYRIRTIKPIGFYQPKFGTHILTKPPELKPGGIVQNAFGTTFISNHTRNIFAGLGRDTQEFGEYTVWFKYRYINTNGSVSDQYGTPRIEHGRRTLLVQGHSHTSYGNAWLSHAVRSLAATSIEYPKIPIHYVGRHQEIRPSGFIATLFGSRIVPESQSIYPQGFINSFGLAIVDLWKKNIKPTGFLSTGQEGGHRFGTAKFWNLRQYIVQVYDDNSGLVPPKWTGWTNIENKNKTIGAIGSNFARVGEPDTENKARLLSPSGLSALTFGQAMIADRVRSLKLQGIEPPYMSSWSVIYNAAHVIAQKGFKADGFGVATILNTRRYFNRIGNFESLEFGKPMITDRIRTLKFEQRYTIAPPSIPIHKIHLHTRYIEEVGRFDDYQAFGNPSLSIHWNIITPRWTMRDVYGSPTVKNVTPELGTRGRNSEEFGQASIRTQWRELLHQGSETVVWGGIEVAFRDRQFSVNGFTQWAIPRHTVIKTGVPPYYPQYIWLDAVEIDGEQNDGHGIEPPPYLLAQVPRPSLRTNVLQPLGFVATEYGNHYTQSNGILVQPGLQELTIGNHIIGLKNRQIIVESVGDLMQVSEPRLSPHTIYAIMEAPEQAKKNHPYQNLHPINYHGSNAPVGEIFGTTTITLQHRKLNNVGLGLQSRLSDGHKLELRKRFIDLTNYGFRSWRVGFHVVGPFDQHLEQFDSSDMQSFGSPSLSIPYGGTYHIKPNGISSPILNKHMIDFFNRMVQPHGVDQLNMGAQLNNDNPFMWQGLRVGELIKGNYGGFENEVFGQTLVSNKIRELSVNGFESFACEYDYTAFDKRMRVYRKTIPRPQIHISPVGVDALVVTVPNIKPAVHYIRPDGNADQYRKGAF